MAESPFPSGSSPNAAPALGPGTPGLVSCVIPAYQAERWLADAVRSVLDQTWSAVEVIVVDDGSTDRTHDVAASFGDRVRVLRQPNAGPAVALNHGIGESSGELLAFLDADDTWPREKLELQVARLVADPGLQACYGMVQNFWVEELKIEEEALIGHRIRDPIPGLVTGTLLTRRATFDEVGLFEDRRHAYALDWAMRLKERGIRHEVLDEVLLFRRYHEGNMSREGGARSRDQVLDLLKRALDAKRGG
jgi:glycosyltransferase involved in cell wall biosynthesis